MLAKAKRRRRPEALGALRADLTERGQGRDPGPARRPGRRPPRRRASPSAGRWCCSRTHRGRRGAPGARRGPAAPVPLKVAALKVIGETARTSRPSGSPRRSTTTLDPAVKMAMAKALWRLNGRTRQGQGGHARVPEERGPRPPRRGRARARRDRRGRRGEAGAPASCASEPTERGRSARVPARAPEPRRGRGGAACAAPPPASLPPPARAATGRCSTR